MERIIYEVVNDDYETQVVHLYAGEVGDEIVELADGEREILYRGTDKERAYRMQDFFTNYIQLNVYVREISMNTDVIKEKDVLRDFENKNIETFVLRYKGVNYPYEGN